MRRMWAAGLAMLVCLALGGLPVVAQSPSPGQSPAAQAGYVAVTGTSDCVLGTAGPMQLASPPYTLTNQVLKCDEVASDPRVTGQSTVAINIESWDRGGMVAGVPANAVSWSDSVLQGPEGTWSGHQYGFYDKDGVLHLVGIASGSGAYEGLVYVSSATAPRGEAHLDLVGLIQPGSAPPGFPEAPSPTGTVLPTGKWTAQQDALWVLELRPDGTWTATAGASLDSQGEISSGTYSTDNDMLTFLTDTLCTEQNAEQGTYSWTHANDQLTLTVQSDTCMARVGAIDQGVVWTAAP